MADEEIALRQAESPRLTIQEFTLYNLQHNLRNWRHAIHTEPQTEH